MPNASEPSAEKSTQALLGGEHQRLEESFDAIVKASMSEEPADFREAWQTFEHELLAHFDVEEADVLPAFSTSEPREAKEILDQHARLRSRLLELAIDLDLHCLEPEKVTAFVDELRYHAAREELLLYPWAARQLGNVAGLHLHAMNKEK